MTPPKPRRPGGPGSRAPGSRTPASRPRRVAGSGAGPSPASPAPPAPPPADVEDEDEAGAAAGTTSEQAAPRERSRAARGLLVAIVVLLALAVVEVVVIVGRDDPGVATAPPSADRPVQLSQLTVRSVVDQAAAAATTILSASSSSPQAYDEQVETATAMMTDSFAEEYAATKAEIKDDFLAASTEVSVDVSAQGVVQASADEVEALLFLTQTTSKQDSAVTPVQYRVTVTMLRSGDGWLVSRLEAK